MGENNHHLLIDISQLTSDVSTELNALRPLLDTYCIYRAPKRLQVLKEEAYIPQCVSIGPYHHKREELKPMEEHKKRYLQYFLRRINKSLEDLVTIVAMNEENLRNCYAEIIDMSSHEFAKMILVDATFIIEFLFRLEEGIRDNIFNKAGLGLTIYNDLCLFENQLPFFIIEELFKVYDPCDGERKIRELALEFGNWVWNYQQSSIEEIVSWPEIKHLLDFVRICNRPLEQRECGNLERPNMPTAIALHHAGVKFQPRPYGHQSIFDIRFSNGILEIPPFYVNDCTEVLYRNLIASEQRDDIDDNFHNDYFRFMNLFANTKEDVEFLIQKEIIHNWQSNSERISDLFHGLAEAVVINARHFYFESLVKDFNSYCNVCHGKIKSV